MPRLEPEVEIVNVEAVQAPPPKAKPRLAARPLTRRMSAPVSNNIAKLNRDAAAAGGVELIRKLDKCLHDGTDSSILSSLDTTHIGLELALARFGGSHDVATLTKVLKAAGFRDLESSPHYAMLCAQVLDCAAEDKKKKLHELRKQLIVATLHLARARSNAKVSLMDYAVEKVVSESHGVDSAATAFRPWAEPRSAEVAVRWVAVNELDMNAACELQVVYELPALLVQEALELTMRGDAKRLEMRSHDEDWHYLSFPVVRLTQASVQSHKRWKVNEKRRKAQQKELRRQKSDHDGKLRQFGRALGRLGRRLCLCSNVIQTASGAYEEILEESELLVEVESQYLALFIRRQAESSCGSSSASDTILSFTTSWKVPSIMSTKAGAAEERSLLDELDEPHGDLPTLRKLSVRQATWLLEGSRRWVMRAKTRCARQWPREIFDLAAAQLRQELSLIRKPDAMWLVHAILELCVEQWQPIMTMYRHKLDLYSAKLHEQESNFPPTDMKALLLIRRELDFLTRKVRPAQRVLRHLAAYEQEEGLSKTKEALHRLLEDLEEIMAIAIEEAAMLVRVIDGLKEEFSAFSQKKQARPAFARATFRASH